MMNAVIIGSCRADDDGGAVFIKQGGFFVMNGGTIENCTAGANGGAVNIYENGSFTMTGGIIKDCKVDLGGLGNAIYVNGQKVSAPFIGGAMYIPSIKTITMPTVTVIDVVEIKGLTVSFKDGDKPVFTGKVPDGANYAYRCEWWELDSKTGAMSTAFGNFYENKFTAFEAGKTYHYGVYVTTHGEVENVSHIFWPDTKLKINGEFVNYKRYEGDTSDGSDGTMWVITDLAITPQDTGVKVDGNAISAEQYTATSGSTVITLKKNYLATLPVGKHSLTIVYNDGECSTEFEIKAASNQNSNSPKTGDGSNPVLWSVLLLVSACGAICITELSRKRKKNH